MLRAAVAAQTTVGVLAKEYMDAGKLVPDEVIIGVVSSIQKNDIRISLF
jgi:adenylate kinase